MDLGAGTSEPSRDLAILFMEELEPTVAEICNHKPVLLLFRIASDGLLVQALEGAVLKGRCTDGPVEPEGRGVPVEAEPLHPAAAPLLGKTRKVLQECLPVAPSPLLRDDEKVFQVQALPPHEGGEIVEEQGEADDCSVLLPEENLGAVLHEKGAVEGGFVRGHLIGALPIGGQLPDEVKDHSGLVSPCRADSEFAHFAQS